MFLHNLIIFTLILGTFFIEGCRKGDGKKLIVDQNTKYRATTFPSTPKSKNRSVKPDQAVILNPSDERVLPKLKLLHEKWRYDKNYLKEYRKMIRSLLPEAEKYVDFGSKEFLVLPDESKTDKSVYSAKKAKFHSCSTSKTENWNEIKVLQLEKCNSVTLKQNSQSGAKVVEKLMTEQKHYDKEMNFFRHAHHGSLKYFPSLICASQPKNRNGRYSIVTEFVEGQNSHLMAAVATTEQLRFMVAQFFNSVVELHKVGFIHCDLTPANVIVTSDFEVKLIDFGMAMLVGEANGFRGSTFIPGTRITSNDSG